MSAIEWEDRSDAAPVDEATADEWAERLLGEVRMGETYASISAGDRAMFVEVTDEGDMELFDCRVLRRARVPE